MRYNIDEIEDISHKTKEAFMRAYGDYLVRTLLANQPIHVEMGYTTPEEAIRRSRAPKEKQDQAINALKQSGLA